MTGIFLLSDLLFFPLWRHTISGTQQLYNRKEIFSWTLYDFANSAFTTLVVTFIYSTYFTKSIALDEISGTVLWSRGVTISAILVAALSPVMGAMADKAFLRKPFLLSMTIISIVATVALYFVLPGQTTQALVIFIIANFAFEMSMVFYNAYLPDITSLEKIGRVSGYGWSFGYFGGLLCLVLALVGFVNPEVPWFGFTTENGENIRATNLLVAAWFAVFSIPAFIWLETRRYGKTISTKTNIKLSLMEIWDTLRSLKDYKEIIKFLIARIFYNDGLITIFAFGGIYAAGTFGFNFEEIIIFGIVLNVTAGLGAFILGFADDKLGGKTTVQISNFGLLFATILAVIAPDKSVFWIAGILVGVFSGPNQAASRSLMGRFVPKSKINEFYGFYAFSGKATTFAGPVLFGVLTGLFNTQRAGVAAILFFFLAGAIILAFVNEKKGIRQAVPK